MTIDTDLAGTESLMSLVLFASLFFFVPMGPVYISLTQTFQTASLISEYPRNALSFSAPFPQRNFWKQKTLKRGQKKALLRVFLNLMLMKSPNHDIIKSPDDL